jgi:site-specific DNA-methyltransferase (adenine-specific)
MDAATVKPTIKDFVGKMLHGDVIKKMQELPGRSIQVVVTSPPYNLRNSTGGGMHNGSGGKWSKAKLLKGYETDGEEDSNYEDDMPHEHYVLWQRDSLREMMRVLRPDGAIFYNHKWRVQAGEWQDRSDIVQNLPLPVRQIIIWARKGGINFNRGYFLPSYEVIYLFAGPDFVLEPGANALTDVWQITQDLKNPHPASFPEEIAMRCIKSVKKGVVLDPFMGSGTTAIAAETLGRPWIGIDNSKMYCKMAENRVAEARRQRVETGILEPDGQKRPTKKD